MKRWMWNTSLVLAVGCGNGLGDEAQLVLDDEAEPGARPQPVDDLTTALEPTARVAGFDVTIVQAATDIDLNWVGLGPSFTYDVWRSTDPYFAPGDPGSLLLVGGVVGTSFTDVGGNNTTSYYYRVTATDGTDTYNSTIVGKFVQPLVTPGWSLLGFPLLETNNLDAATLGAEIPGSTEVWRWDPHQRFYTPTHPSPPWAAPTFAWEAGEAVAVNAGAASPTSYTQVGYVPEQTDISRLLLLANQGGIGQNVVTVPLSVAPTDALGLAAQEPDIRQLTDWNTTTQSFDDFYAPAFGVNFSIEPGQGLWVYVDADTVWPLCANDDTWGDLLSVGPMTTSAPGQFVTQNPQVAMADDGSYVVAWNDEASTFGAWFQRYGADGVALAPPVQASDVGHFTNVPPAVAMAPDGRFIVAWTATNQGTFATYLRVFDPDGVPVTATITASPVGTHFVTGTPAVAMADNGDFVVVWTSVGTSPFAPFGQRFAADGTPLGTFFQASDPSDFVTGRPAVAMDADGDFAIGWTSVGVPPFAPFVRHYAANGTALTTPQQVSDPGTFTTDGIAMDMTGDGRLAVAWRDEGDFFIRFRTYDAAGVAATTPIQVNPAGTFANQPFGGFPDDESGPSAGIGMFDDGTVVVSYSVFDTGNYDGFIARYAADLTPFAPPEMISPDPGQFFAVPYLATGGCRDDFVLTWPDWQGPFMPLHALYLSDDDGNGTAEQCCYSP